MTLSAPAALPSRSASASDAAACQPGRDGGGQRVAGAPRLDRFERRRDGVHELAVDERAGALVAVADDDAAGARVDEVLHRRLDRCRTARADPSRVELLVADLEHVDAALDDGLEPVAGQVGDDAPAVRPDVDREPPVEVDRHDVGAVLRPAEHGDLDESASTSVGPVEVVDAVPAERRAGIAATSTRSPLRRSCT